MHIYKQEQTHLQFNTFL